MKENVRTSVTTKIVVVLVVAILTAMTASAVSWYQNMSVKLGSISVVELADWMIRGNADYTTVYVAPQVSKIQKINNLVCISEDGALLQELNKLPAHKKWVVITRDGSVSAETSRLLAQSQGNTILVLKGGRQAWESQILSASVADLSLSVEESSALANVRPYFNESASETIVAAPAVRPVAAGSAPSVSDADEPEEEEGC